MRKVLTDERFKQGPKKPRPTIIPQPSRSLPDQQGPIKKRPPIPNPTTPPQGPRKPE